MTRYKSQKGQLLVMILIFSSIALVVMGGIMNWTKVTIESNRRLLTREKAIQLAESGIDYYRWHLAHAQSDYQDGTNAAGPYIHHVYDKDGNEVGVFELNITPPVSGSTKVRIESTGKPVGSDTFRTIRVEMAIPSLAKYALVANDVMRFGSGTEVYGPIHSNYGIRFDGKAYNLVTSAVTSYNDTDSDDCNTGSSFGVHTCVSPNDPSVPASVPNRPDVFVAGRLFPVPTVDFTGLTSDLSNIKSQAQTNGRYISGSGSQGYQIVLRNNDTFDLYKVTSQINQGGSCTNSQSQSGWASWSINNKTFVANYAIPSNGLVFVEDNIWVEGLINSARVTIVAARFPDNPSNRPSITINNDLNYTNYDGRDVVALISQGNINVGLRSDTDLRIDAALVAQNGRVGRYYYPSGCSPYQTRNSITLYGMIASNIRYGFAYTDNTGYQTRNIIYDANLLYGPPPSFPLTSDQYEILSWEEVL